jgi:glycerophosphoryl diester phosphodiesterase
VTDETADFVRRVSLGVLRAWRPLLGVHLLCSAVAFAVIAPAGAAVLRAIVALSERPIVADQDILSFAATPAGLIALALVAVAALGVLAIEQAAMTVIAFGDLQGWHVRAIDALRFVLARLRGVLELTARLLGAVLARMLPAALGGALIAWALLADHDINYYLAAKPPQFVVAVVLAAAALCVAAWFTFLRLAGWSLSLPILLLVEQSPARALAISVQHTLARIQQVCRAWLLWAIATILLPLLLWFVLDAVAAQVVPSAADSVRQVFATLVVLLGVAAAVSVLVAAFNAATFALLTVSMFDRWIPELRESIRGIAEVATHEPRKPLPLVAIGALAATLVLFALVTVLLLASSIEVDDDVAIIAHRGAASVAPENTLAAVRAAIAAQTDAVEIDVQESADGEVMVVHDSDFMKLAGVALKVWDGSFDEIRSIDVGSWFTAGFRDERVPTLQEVLETARGYADVVIELKYYGHDQRLEQRVVAIVEAAGMQDHVEVMSLDYGGVSKLHALRPDWPTGLLMARGFGDLAALDVDFVAVNAGMASRRFVRAAHAAGKKVYVWTINDATHMSSVISLGVDGLITDEPRLARRVLTERAALSPAGRLLVRAADRFDWLPARKPGRDDSP